MEPLRYRATVHGDQNYLGFTKCLIATQFCSRLIPFLFNFWVLRRFDASNYASHAVQALFLTIILFLSRDSIRRACMRVDIRCYKKTYAARRFPNLAAFAKMWEALQGGSQLTGFVIMAFGPSYSYLFIRVACGRTWSDGEAPTILGYYCFYVFLLAMNGTSEAFLHAVATENQFKHLICSSIIFSVIYLPLNIVLTQSAGVVGLISANSLHMILRIIYSMVFIRHYFQDSSSFAFWHCLPSGWTVLLLSGVTTLISEKIFVDRENFWPTISIHLAVGLICFFISSIVIYHRERTLINKFIRYRDHVE